jgi:hypothetical protein
MAREQFVVAFDIMVVLGTVTSSPRPLRMRVTNIPTSTTVPSAPLTRT